MWQESLRWDMMEQEWEGRGRLGKKGRLRAECDRSGQEELDKGRTG